MKERNKKIKEKATKTTMIVDIILLIILLFDQFTKKWNGSILEIASLVIIVLMMTFITWTVFKISTKLFNQDEDEKESKQLVESVLSSQKYIEVIPIKASIYEEFICGLTDIAKFYAIIDEKDKVKISVKFKNENQLRNFETLDKEYFKKYYKLPSKTE